MSKAEILAELPKLTPAERQEIRLKLARLDGQAWLDTDDPNVADATLDLNCQWWTVREVQAYLGLPSPGAARIWM